MRDPELTSQFGLRAVAGEEFFKSVHASHDSVPIITAQGCLSPLVVSLYDNGEMEAKLSTFGERMRYARERRHFALQQVAEYCGLQTHMAVAHWESGQNFPRLDALVAAAGLYEVSIDWLVWGGEMGRGIDERVRKIPAALRPGLIVRLHEEIDKTEEAAKRLPPEMLGDVVKDGDKRLQGWSAANLRRRPKMKGTQ